MSSAKMAAMNRLQDTWDSTVAFTSIYDYLLWIIRIIKMVNIDFGKQHTDFQKHFRFGLTMQFMPYLEQLQALAWFHPLSVYPMANIVPLEPLHIALVPQGPQW